MGKSDISRARGRLPDQLRIEDPRNAGDDEAHVSDAFPSPVADGDAQGHAEDAGTGGGAGAMPD